MRGPRRWNFPRAHPGIYHSGITIPGIPPTTKASHIPPTPRTKTTTNATPHSCDCCTGAINRAATTTNLDASGAPVPVFQCAFARPGGADEPSGGGENVCTEQCMQNDFNQVLKAADGGKTDHTRYCPYSCRPQTQKQGATWGV